MKEFTCRFRDIEVAVHERTPSAGDWRTYSAAPRMYVQVKDETILENLSNRRTRPYNEYKRLIWGSLLTEVFNLGKLQWSQYAGCSCPCSPGFILPRQTLNLGGQTFSHFDVWITLEGAPVAAGF